MKKALVVGLNDYPECELKCCSNDANSISDLLEANGDGSPNFDVKKIIDKCTKPEFQTAVNKLFSDDADVALLYFSGHGAEKDGGYLVTTDFAPDALGMKMEDVLTLANSSHCKNKVIILDCCFAARMGESMLCFQGMFSFRRKRPSFLNCCGTIENTGEIGFFGFAYNSSQTVVTPRR